ncbi:MAG: shikimate dehydrogenase, partial [Bacteroidota bacterium]
NRDIKKAQLLAECVGGTGLGLDATQRCYEEGYDFLINATPVEMPIDPSFILPGSKVMDIKTRPMETELLQKAKEKQCTIIYGYQMFIEQAIGQWHLWFKDNFEIELFHL